MCLLRFNPRGPDERMGQDEYDNYVSTYRTKLPEDTGYLSYGPANGRCNKWKETYQSHRTVWSQWLMGELVKVGRQFCLTATQLALAWVYSRPFVCLLVLPRVPPRFLSSSPSDQSLPHVAWPWFRGVATFPRVSCCALRAFAQLSRQPELL